jgi:hypothetical protein
LKNALHGSMDRLRINWVIYDPGDRLQKQYRPELQIRGDISLTQANDIYLWFTTPPLIILDFQEEVSDNPMFSVA